MKRTAAEVPAGLAKSLTERWQAGERLPALGKVASEELKRHVAPVTVRGWIIKTLGGPGPFQAASAERDSKFPRTKPKPPTRPKREPGAPAPVMDDSKVPVVAGDDRKLWGSLSITVRGYSEDVFTSPDGQRYVRAAASEKADVIADLTDRGLGRIRMRLEEGSRLAKRARKERKLVKKGEEQKQRRLSEPNTNFTVRRKK